MAAIEVDGLVIRYGSLTAVDDVSFTVESGEVVTLLGPNGAGKTSTVETLEGYRRPDVGRVEVLGRDPVADMAALAPRIGVMPQTGGVYPGIRADEMLRLYAGYYAEPTDTHELLGLVGLSNKAKRMWRDLSGGEQQRLSLALALVGRPVVAFLDEPTAGVDISGRQMVRRIVRDLADRGVAVLLTTHDLAEAEKVADRVVIIDHGQLVASGALSELSTTQGGHEIRFGAPAGLDGTALAARLGGPVTEESPGEYRVEVDPTPQTIAALTAWLAERDVPLADLRARRHRLEDIFLSLTAPGDADGGIDQASIDV